MLHSLFPSIPLPPASSGATHRVNLSVKINNNNGKTETTSDNVEDVTLPFIEVCLWLAFFLKGNLFLQLNWLISD